MRLDVASGRTFPTGISERKDFFKSPEESEVAYSLPIVVRFSAFLFHDLYQGL